MDARIVVVAGDGIGPEVTREARRVLEAVAVAFERQKPYLVEHWR